ncbi:J domain-containing protein [Sphingobacterium faecium]|uniref:J domain-containing protein n=1 Tax=Sphingobacterium faecium TaxID=34087 RepID=UPI00320A7CC5
MAKKGFLEGYKTYDTTAGFGNFKKWKSSFKERMTKDDAAHILKDSKDSPYAILDVLPNATYEIIKKAFRKKIREWHPDKNQDRVFEAEQQSRKIIAAYTHLTSKL